MNNLEYYKVFYYAAKYGSLTMAAQKLSISQPAVSQSMKQLEQATGARLFIRSARGICLTREGELLYSYVAKGYEQILLGEKLLQQMMNLELGEIRIGASDMTLQFYLLPYLEIFHEKYPGIKVTISNAPTPETLSYLEAGQIDFGVVSTPFSVDETMHVQPVREIEDIFVAGRRFISYKHKTLDLQELERLPIISLAQNTSTRTYMDSYLQKNGVELRPEFELATSDMIVQFALRNLGVGSVMKDFAREQLAAGTLFELRFNKKIPGRRFCVVTRTKNPLPTAAENLLALLQKEEGKKEDGKNKDQECYF